MLLFLFKGEHNASDLNYASLSRAHIDEDLSGGSFKSGAQATVNLASLQEVLRNCAAGSIDIM